MALWSLQTHMPNLPWQRVDRLLENAFDYRDSYNERYQRMVDDGVEIPSTDFGLDECSPTFIQNLSTAATDEWRESWDNDLIGIDTYFSVGTLGYFRDVIHSGFFSESWIPWIALWHEVDNHPELTTLQQGLCVVAIAAMRIHWFKVCYNIRLINGVEHRGIYA